MKNFLPFLIFLFANSVSVKADVIITGIVDGTLSGGLPKAIELYVCDTEDLSNWSLCRSSNGGAFGSDFTLSGTYTNQYVYLTNNAAGFASIFGSFGDFANVIVSGNISGNGNDGFALKNAGGTVVDMVWEANSSNYYLDSYAYRLSGTGPNPVFDAAEWAAPGNNILDGLTAAQIGSAVPFGTYAKALLSVELLDFTATPKTNSIQLDWVTLSESDAHSFIIEKSTDGLTFRSSATIAANGNNTQPTNYKWEDKRPEIGANYYRLKSTDTDGSFIYSDIVVAKFEVEGNTMTVLTNLSEQAISVSFSKEADKPVQLSIYHLSGQLAQQSTIQNTTEVETINIAELPQGMYLITAKIDAELMTKQFMKF